MRRQFLRDLGDDALGNLGMKNPAKIAQYFRWRDDHKFLETIGVGMAIKHFGKLTGKPLLCKVMPVDFLHGTSSDAETVDGSPRAIGPLRTRRRVFPLKDPLDSEANT